MQGQRSHLSYYLYNFIHHSLLWEREEGGLAAAGLQAFNQYSGLTLHMLGTETCQCHLMCEGTGTATGLPQKKGETVPPAPSNSPQTLLYPPLDPHSWPWTGGVMASTCSMDPRCNHHLRQLMLSPTWHCTPAVLQHPSEPAIPKHQATQNLITAAQA